LQSRDSSKIAAFARVFSCDGRTRADFRPIRAVVSQPERRERPCYSTIYRP
jgi:hypothetical protein